MITPDLKSDAPAKVTENVLTVVCGEGMDSKVETAKAVSGSVVGNALVLQTINQKTLGSDLLLQHYTDALIFGVKRVNGDDLKSVEGTLYSQGVALNALFTNLAVKAAHNFNAGSQYAAAASDYLKLALKAQNQSRMTLETLAAVKNPQVVFTKQANINNGGQQQVNNGTGPVSHAHESENSRNKILEPDNG